MDIFRQVQSSGVYSSVKRIYYWKAATDNYARDRSALNTQSSALNDTLNNAVGNGIEQISLYTIIVYFFFAQVQAVLRRHWNQYNIQFSSVGTHSDALRSASYTASSITEVQGCYSIDGHSEHMNGKSGLDSDSGMLKSENSFN